MNVQLTVTNPARRPVGPGEPVPDPTPIYVGVWSAPNVCPSVIGAAVVAGGTRSGNSWLACTYSTSVYTIPGIGDVQIISG